MVVDEALFSTSERNYELFSAILIHFMCILTRSGCSMYVCVGSWK